METGKIIAWGIVAAMLGTIVFVRAGQSGGESGGTQASNIINATATGAANVLHAAEGM
jgi:preprotein translocase subunit SecG